MVDDLLCFTWLLIWNISPLQGDLQTVEQLLSQGADPNSDPTVGPPALWEAAHHADAAMVSMFLQFRANHSQTDPASGSTALHVAVSKNSDQVVRLLLAYGAIVDIPDSAGTTARRAAALAAPSIQLLFRILEKHGPVGLEDPPGTWHLFEDKQNGKPFYFNPTTQESRWMKPPSCSWQRMLAGGQPIYVNDITHQSMWTMPPALCWKKVSLPGADAIWLNFRNNATQPKLPAEITIELAQELEKTPSQYWFNVVTGESQWNDPKEDNWNQLQDVNDRKYWFRPSTTESTYLQPPEAAWRKIESKEHDRPFYYNDVTSEATWTKPAPLGWIQHDEL